MSIKTYGSLFAGVGGIDLGLDSSNLECLFQVEIDENCIQTLSYHWPNVPKYRDIKDVSGYDLPPVDLITFGSPCQDLSVAGKRAGLSGERSSLFYEATRIIREMREKTNGQYPKWSIWENVAGALSSNDGADFGEVLHEMDEAGACFSEWALLDAQYFGVPQRRRRVYLISCFDPATADRSPTPLFPLTESLPGNSKKSSKKGQDSSSEIASCLRSGGEGGLPSSRRENLVIQTLIDPTRVNDVRVYEEPVQTLQRRMGTGGNNVPLIAVDNAIGFSHTQGLDMQPSEKTFPTLRANGAGQAVAIPNETANQINQINVNREGSFGQFVEGEFGTLKQSGGVLGGGSETLIVLNENTQEQEQDKVIIRRLTPIECERLMGWPDNHTLYRSDGKLNSDTTRYKMCGNGVVSNVIEWLAQYIVNI